MTFGVVEFTIVALLWGRLVCCACYAQRLDWTIPKLNSSAYLTF